METKETKNCPYCGEEILAIAKKCRFCGEWLPEEKPKVYVPCPICGESIEEDVEICPFCNERVKKDETSTPSSNAKVEEIIPQVTESKSEVQTEVHQESLDKDNAAPIVPQSGNSIFPTIFTGKSLREGIVILFLLRIIVSLFNYVDHPGMTLAVNFFDSIILCIISVLIVQRVLKDKSKINLASWLAIGGVAFWCIAIEMGTSAIQRPGLDFFNYMRYGDTNEAIWSIRYFMKGGLVCFIISCLMDGISRFIMWQNGYEKYKSTMVVGIIYSAIALIFTILSPSMSESAFLLIILCGIAGLAYYIMLLVNGGKEITANEDLSLKERIHPAVIFGFLFFNT